MCVCIKYINIHTLLIHAVEHVAGLEGLFTFYTGSLALKYLGGPVFPLAVEWLEAENSRFREVM